jgi:hypothetical protein
MGRPGGCCPRAARSPLPGRARVRIRRAAGRGRAAAGTAGESRQRAFALPVTDPAPLGYRPSLPARPSHRRSPGARFGWRIRAWWSAGGSGVHQKLQQARILHEDETDGTGEMNASRNFLHWVPTGSLDIVPVAAESAESTGSSLRRPDGRVAGISGHRPRPSRRARSRTLRVRKPLWRIPRDSSPSRSAPGHRSSRTRRRSSLSAGPAPP